MSAASAEVRSFDGPGAGVSGIRPVDLVFRTVGERTSDLALGLALEQIRPRRVHVLSHIKPFAAAVARMLSLDHEGATQVVHMDADCLILEDLRPFLEENELPYVDSFVNDRFRGRIHCGVHFTRTDVIARMKEIPPPEGDLAFVLRPESRRRNLALESLGFDKQLKGFRILHDHFQRYTDIFAKYALRELRSRSPFQRKRLEAAMAHWPRSTVNRGAAAVDLDVARAAVAHAAAAVGLDAPADAVHAYIAALPELADAAIAEMGLSEQAPLTLAEVQRSIAADATFATEDLPRPKVFGLGLSRTGTHSLTTALHVLGYDTVHYPTDMASLSAMMRGDGAFPLLNHYDGITDITTIPFLSELDARHPGSKFILTVRDEAAWLASCEKHWSGRDPFEPAQTSSPPLSYRDHTIHMEIRRLLRAAVYGSYVFDRDRFARVRREHHERVKRYFADRPKDLLVVDIAGGAGWKEIAPFVERAIPDQPFPHKNRARGEGPKSVDPDD